MAERQPMLSFAKVVSGQTGGETPADVPIGEPSPPRPQLVTQKSEKGDKQERGEKSEKFHGNKRRAPKHRADREKFERRNLKPEPVKEEKVIPLEEAPPQSEPIILEPAPLPAVNAWFKKKGMPESPQSLDSTPAPVVPIEKEEKVEKKCDVRVINMVSESIKTPESPRSNDLEWPTLDAAKVEEIQLNGSGSRQQSPTLDSSKEESEFVGQKVPKVGKSSWKKIDIDVDYGNKAKPSNASRDKIVSKKKREDGKLNGDFHL
uniref:La-related protein 1 n=1 Tax=Heterorhabditis bacteriophora TaxID=37862 RepID=A0A1I7XAV0_HETBA